MNTYVLPGKNDCISIRNEDGIKTKKQKCLLLCTLIELYELFKKEHVTESIGFLLLLSYVQKTVCLLEVVEPIQYVCVLFIKM